MSAAALLQHSTELWSLLDFLVDYQFWTWRSRLSGLSSVLCRSWCPRQGAALSTTRSLWRFTPSMSCRAAAWLPPTTVRSTTTPPTWKATTVSMQSSKYVHTTDVENSYSEYAMSKVRPHHWCGKQLQWICKVQSTTTMLMWKTTTVSMQSSKYVHTTDVENC